MQTELSRRAFLAAGAAVATMPLVRAATPKRNLLFVASDDLNTCLGAYGHPVVRTPNIDRIAARGVVFQRAYCQNPWCGLSRASLMTGLSPDSVGVHDLTTHFRSNLPDVVTLPQLFQKHGYFTGRVGKVYHFGVPGQIGTDGLDDKPSWHQVVNPNGVDHTKEEPLVTNFTPKRGLGSAVAFHASTARDEEHTDGIGAAAAIEMIEQHRREPFFVGLGFYRPHCPYIAPAKYFDAIPLERIQPPMFDDAEMRQAPEWAYFTTPANWGMTVQQQREAIRGYYAAIEFMDAQFGKVLDTIDRLGLADNTTIVFWGDNGYHLGDHGQWMKQTVGTGAIMPGYAIPVGRDAVGMGFSTVIINDLLRGKYRYDGLVVTDWLRNMPWGVENLTEKQRQEKIVLAGSDQIGGNNQPGHVIELAKDGVISPARLDASARRALIPLLQLGLFENPYVDPARADAVVASLAFVNAGKDAQTRSMVLLKHATRLLPVSAGKRVFVQNISRDAAAKYGTVVDDPKAADVAVIEVTAPFTLREATYAGRAKHGTLAYAGAANQDQLQAINTLAASGTPTVVVMYMDRPAILTEFVDKVGAVLAHFNASEAAILDVVFGKDAPGGKLPFDLPRDMASVERQKEDVPFDLESPLFKYGFGLSYGPAPARVR